MSAENEKNLENQIEGVQDEEKNEVVSQKEEEEKKKTEKQKMLEERNLQDIQPVLRAILGFNKYGNTDRVRIKDEKGEYRFLKDEFIEAITKQFMLDEFEATGLNKLENNHDRQEKIRNLIWSVTTGINKDSHQFIPLTHEREFRNLNEHAFYSGVALKNMVGKYGTQTGSDVFFAHPEYIGRGELDYQREQKATADFVKKHIKTFNLLVSFARGLGDNAKLVMGDMGDMSRDSKFIGIFSNNNIEITKEGMILPANLDLKEKKDLEKIFLSNLDQTQKDSQLISENAAKEKSATLTNLSERLNKLEIAFAALTRIIKEHGLENNDSLGKAKKTENEIQNLEQRLSQTKDRKSNIQEEIADLPTGFLAIFAVGKINKLKREEKDLDGSILVLEQRILASRELLKKFNADYEEMLNIKKEFGSEYQIKEKISTLKREIDDTEKGYKKRG